MKIRLSALAALIFAVACEPTKEPTSIAAPSEPSEIILDGAHGGNKDFFFLPPMVPLPLGNRDFELGKFNNTLRPSLKIEICELKSENLNAQGLPSATTGCVADAPKKTFAPGSVQLVNLPVRQNGWWNLFNLPPDGFYYVLWDTRQSNLNVSKYYRIKVFIDGNSTPLGVADVDPMANLFQWKYTNTGQVIQLVDDVLLPIPFRVEKGGGSTLCGVANLCVSTTITNNNPAGFQTVTVDGGAGAIGGAKFPNGWLPATGPQNVVVTIASVDLGSTNAGNGTSGKPCHIGLPLQQFPGCFHFTVTPALAPINENGDQFAQAVTVAVCYSLQGTGDAREKFAEMYASGPNEPAHALADANDVGILSAAARNCNTTPIIGAAPSNSATQFARATWSKIRTGLGSVFGVQTAYGVDLGLGGLTKRFSNIGPALAATIQPVGPTAVTLVGGGNFQAFVRIVGSNHHDNEHQNTIGLGGLPVQFQVAAANGTIAQLGDEIGGATQLSVITNTNPIDPESPSSGGGYAAVNWAVPTAPGTYQVSANGPVLGGPITFTVTVTGARSDLFISSGNPVLNSFYAFNRTVVPAPEAVMFVDTVTQANGGGVSSDASMAGWYISTDPTLTTADRLLFQVPLPAIGPNQSAKQPLRGMFIHDLAPGTYYAGYLLDNVNQVAETNELNNFTSASFEVRQALEFETYPAGAGVCDGLAACSVTNDFANAGVLFSFVPTNEGAPTTASLCRTTHGQGTGSNFGVTPAANSDCTGWDGGTVRMTFPSHPTTIWFSVTGNNSAPNTAFPISGLDAAGATVFIQEPGLIPYLDQSGNPFRREIRRVESANGIASIDVQSAAVVLFIDNVLIIQ